MINRNKQALLFLVLTLTLPHQTVFFPSQNLSPVSFVQKQGKGKYFQSVDGAQIHYETRGNPHSKSTIVFLHGFASNAAFWGPVLRNRFLIDNYRLILITLRGHGFKERRSDMGFLKPGEFYETVCKDIHGILTKEKCASAIFMTHSMGGNLFFHFYSKFPQQVSSAILISGFHHFPLKGKPLLNLLSLLVKATSWVLLKSNALLNVFATSKNQLSQTNSPLLQRSTGWFADTFLFEKSKPENKNRFVSASLSTHPRALLLSLYEMISYRKSSLPQIPILMIHGSKDRLVDEGALPHAPNIRFELFPQKHLPHLDRRFPETLNSFLEGLCLDTSC